MWELDTLQYDAITVCFPSRNPNQPDSLVSLKHNSIKAPHYAQELYPPPGSRLPPVCGL